MPTGRIPESVGKAVLHIGQLLGHAHNSPLLLYLPRRHPRLSPVFSGEKEPAAAADVHMARLAQGWLGSPVQSEYHPDSEEQQHVISPSSIHSPGVHGEGTASSSMVSFDNSATSPPLFDARSPSPEAHPLRFKVTTVSVSTNNRRKCRTSLKGIRVLLFGGVADRSIA
jgi:hypothetical protein